MAEILQEKEESMKRISFLLVICAMLMATAIISPAYVNAEEAAYQIPVNEDGVEAVTIELKSGTKVVAFILRETPDTLFVQNMNNSMEVSFPRSNVAKIRKPTPNEVAKTQKRLGISTPAAPASTGPASK